MKKKGNTRPLWGFVAVSVLVHGAIIGLLSKSIQIGKPEDKTLPDNKPLQAKLIFIPTPIEQAVESAPEENIETAEVTNTEQVPIVETAENEPEVSEKLAVADQPIVEETMPAQQEIPQEPVADVPVETISEAPAIEPSLEPQILTGTGKKRGYPVNSRDIARQHLGNFQQQLQDQLAADSARAFRQQQTSPAITKPSPKPFMTEDEKYFESAKVRVDCSSTVNKSLAFLSGLTGGTLDCSKGQDLSPFIQNRINKLPEGYEKPESELNADNSSGNPR